MKKTCLMVICFLLSLGMISAMAEWGAWLPYWEYEEALNECEDQGHPYDTVIAFEVLFERDGSLYVPMETERMINALHRMYSGTDTKIYVSVVNDLHKANDTFDNKSVSILQTIFQDESSVSRHISDLLNFVDEWRLDGIEIDYENIKNDEKLWGQYEAFLDRLAKELEQNGIEMRIALEPYALRHLSVPETATVSVMCYNLYGDHSGPGPKANLAFLAELAELYDGIRPQVSMAFAAGGFVWQGDRSMRDVTQLEAEKLLRSKGLTCERDEASGVLFVNWMQDGKSMSMWYADGTTLAIWRDAMKEKGYTHFDLFDLDGNLADDLKDHLFTERLTDGEE